MVKLKKNTNIQLLANNPNKSILRCRFLKRIVSTFKHIISEESTICRSQNLSISTGFIPYLTLRDVLARAARQKDVCTRTKESERRM